MDPHRDNRLRLSDSPCSFPAFDCVGRFGQSSSNPQALAGPSTPQTRDARAVSTLLFTFRRVRLSLNHRQPPGSRRLVVSGFPFLFIPCANCTLGTAQQSIGVDREVIPGIPDHSVLDRPIGELELVLTTRPQVKSHTSSSLTRHTPMSAPSSPGFTCSPPRSLPAWPSAQRAPSPLSDPRPGAARLENQTITVLSGTH